MMFIIPSESPGKRRTRAPAAAGGSADDAAAVLCCSLPPCCGEAQPLPPLAPPAHLKNGHQQRCLRHSQQHDGLPLGALASALLVAASLLRGRRHAAGAARGRGRGGVLHRHQGGIGRGQGGACQDLLRSQNACVVLELLGQGLGRAGADGEAYGSSTEQSSRTARRAQTLYTCDGVDR